MEQIKLVSQGRAELFEANSCMLSSSCSAKLPESISCVTEGPTTVAICLCFGFSCLSV